MIELGDQQLLRPRTFGQLQLGGMALGVVPNGQDRADEMAIFGIDRSRIAECKHAAPIRTADDPARAGDLLAVSKRPVEG